jgi:arabinose-5-phosphate isomerase
MEQINIIRDCFENFPDEDYERLITRCAGLLKGGGKIIASGLGKNVPVCEKFVGTMNSFGLDARFLHTNSAVHGDLGMVGPGDMVLLLSKSGNTEESISLAEYLLERGTETWLLSFNKNSKLLSMTENKIVLHLRHEGDPWNIVPNNSTIIYLILLQGLALEVAKRINISLDNFRVNHPGGGIGEFLRSNKHE